MLTTKEINPSFFCEMLIKVKPQKIQDVRVFPVDLIIKMFSKINKEDFLKMCTFEQKE